MPSPVRKCSTVACSAVAARPGSAKSTRDASSTPSRTWSGANLGMGIINMGRCRCVTVDADSKYRCAASRRWEPKRYYGIAGAHPAAARVEFRLELVSCKRGSGAGRGGGPGGTRYRCAHDAGRVAVRGDSRRPAPPQPGPSLSEPVRAAWHSTIASEASHRSRRPLAHNRPAGTTRDHTRIPDSTVAGN